mmetsp:Transcript_20801/g.65848  ORF Transcript_20801/g.65848 Transcript_20801/m.65848 type:complete len:230 (-) Transcript_20801:261-950(-)
MPAHLHHAAHPAAVPGHLCAPGQGRPRVDLDRTVVDPRPHLAADGAEARDPVSRRADHLPLGLAHGLRAVGGVEREERPVRAATEQQGLGRPLPEPDGLDESVVRPVLPQQLPILAPRLDLEVNPPGDGRHGTSLGAGDDHSDLASVRLERGDYELAVGRAVDHDVAAPEARPEVVPPDARKGQDDRVLLPGAQPPRAPVHSAPLAQPAHVPDDDGLAILRDGCTLDVA